MTTRFDRRRFLFGAGGAMLAIPLLESIAPRRASAGGGLAPKRLVVVHHDQGRMVGNGLPDDWWSPGSVTGPLPPVGMAPSTMLAELAPVRDEIVTLDGIDNLVRHASNMEDGHIPALVSTLTCAPQAGTDWSSTGPSIDHVAGLRLRTDAGMRASVILPASATPYFANEISGIEFYGAGGTEPALLSGNPAEAVVELFGPPMPDEGPRVPAAPTLQDRMVARRVDLLSGVTEQLQSLRGRVSAADRERLDRHAQFISNTQALVGGGGAVAPTDTCTRPDEMQMPIVLPSNYEEWQQIGNPPEWVRGRNDAITWPHQLENLVQALACDVVRVIGLTLHGDPAWTSEFPGGSPFEGSNELHNRIHGMASVSNNPQHADDIAVGFASHARKFTELIQRLAAIEDIDGARLLDNTLVVWVSDMGYGSDHQAWNVPVVMAGMSEAFDNGQGRHVVHNRRSMGDLWAHVLRMLGGDDTTFGATGTLGELGASLGIGDLSLSAGHASTTAATPLHMGALDL
ncbi:MAG: DUF1552 domain-containing protein [Myxococcota bacterium]